MAMLGYEVFIDGKIALDVIGVELAKGYHHIDRSAEQAIVEYPNGRKEWLCSSRVEVKVYGVNYE